MLISTHKLNKSMPISLFFVSKFNDIYIKMCFKTSGMFCKKSYFWSLSEFRLFVFGPKNCLGTCDKYAYILETVHLSLFIIIDDIYKVMYCLQFGMFIFDLEWPKEVKSRSQYIKMADNFSFRLSNSCQKDGIVWGKSTL